MQEMLSSPSRNQLTWESLEATSSGCSVLELPSELESREESKSLLESNLESVVEGSISKRLKA